MGSGSGSRRPPRAKHSRLDPFHETPGTRRDVTSRSPRHREPWLLASRAPSGTVIAIELLEPGGGQELTPTIDIEVAAVPLSRPSFLVGSTRVREEQDAARLERVAKLGQDTREVLARHVKQRSVREHTVEVRGRERELEEVLEPHLAGRPCPRHLDETRAAA